MWSRAAAGVQKPLAAGQRKSVPGVLLLVVVGRNVPGGLPRPVARQFAEEKDRLDLRHCGRLQGGEVVPHDGGLVVAAT